MKLPLHTRGVASALALILVGTVATPGATAQNRDLNTERLLLDDDGDGGVRNTLLLEAPSLSSDRVLTFPDAGGTVMTGAAPLTAGWILFGGATGQAAQNSNFSWDNLGGIFNIGAGNFTVAAASGNTVIAGTLDVAGAISNSGGNVTVSDAFVVTGGNFADFHGPIGSTTGDLQIGDAFFVNSGAATDLRVDESSIQRNSGVNETLTFDNTGVGALDVVINGDLSLTGKATSASTVGGDPGTTLVTKDYLVAGNLAVETDATLSGSGITGSPLGIDLTNANSWAGTQTFSSVDINGGTVDGVTIGGTTPAAGTFGTLDANSIATFDADVTVGDSPTDAVTINGTLAGATPLAFEGASSDVNETFFAITDPTAPRTITFPDASGTVALVGEIPVLTDGVTLTGDGTTGSELAIDLTQANSWTGTQTFSSVDVDGGTVDGTAIGGTTPSTGAFTTLAASGTITGGSSLTLGDNTPTAGSVVFNDNSPIPVVGTLTAGLLTGNHTYTLPDASGTIALVGGILTDLTLTGDGTSVDPLRVDLTNANTWTGTQTLPTTTAQGDALIASTNGGTTTIDAARIGSGLTDAQVNDNLTINGGSVDATPVGGTTPSTGAFTKITGTALPATSTSTDLVVSSAGALETRTAASLSGSITVLSDGTTLTGDGASGTELALNLANANTWTATQTLPTTAAQGDALIASTNAGTTTVDAARIGAGLTDAQVNDNLTINGGSVDATPVGATTPSTGAFTTVSTTGAITVNSGAGTDLVIAEGGLDRSSGVAEAIQLNNSGAGAADLLINGATQTTNSRLTVNDGHWTSEQTTSPTVAGTGSFAGGGIAGTDVAGSVSMTSSGVGASTFTVSFNAAYGTAPIVVVTAADANASAAAFYVSGTTTAGFTVTTAATAAANHVYNYHVIEVQ